MKTAISSILIMVAIVLMAGSAVYCDGMWRDQAHTLGEMMMYAVMGFSFFLTCAIIAIKQ